MGRPRKQVVCVRDPQPQNRDPAIVVRKEEIRVCAQRKHRRYIPASVPTVCPDCGHNTRMDDGRHTDPVRQKILEYRTCVKCGALLAAGRDMTEREKEILCTRREAIEEYEKSVIVG